MIQSPPIPLATLSIRAARRGVIAIVVATQVAATHTAAAQPAAPVVDLTNWAQNMLTALENVDQTLQAIRSYQVQLQELEAALQSTAAVPVHTWDRLQSIRNNFEGLVRDLKNYRGFLTDINDYMKQLGDPDFYRRSHCYGPNIDCPRLAWQRVLQAQVMMERRVAAARARSLDQLEAAINHSEGAMATEATEVAQLRRASEGATGQFEAAQLGNELQAATVQQMLQLRATMIARDRVSMVQQRADAARQAAARAASRRYRAKVALASDTNEFPGLDPWSEPPPDSTFSKQLPKDD